MRACVAVLIAVLALSAVGIQAENVVSTDGGVKQWSSGRRGLKQEIDASIQGSTELVGEGSTNLSGTAEGGSGSFVSLDQSTTGTGPGSEARTSGFADAGPDFAVASSTSVSISEGGDTTTADSEATAVSGN